MIAERYRRDYQGEFVVNTTTVRDSIKHQDRVWVPTPIENHHITGYAAVIASNVDRDRFDHTRLQRHRGGLRASRKLFTYGTGDVWRDMRLDYYAGTDQAELQDITQHVVHEVTPLLTRELRYHHVTKIYTSSGRYLENSAGFLLIPHSPLLSDPALPLYLAAFDGVREIYMLGYNKETMSPDSVWHRDVLHIMRTYPGTRFILVGTPSNMPTEWLALRNVGAITHRRFVTQCDI